MKKQFQRRYRWTGRLYFIVQFLVAQALAKNSLNLVTLAAFGRGVVDLVLTIPTLFYTHYMLFFLLLLFRLLALLWTLRWIWFYVFALLQLVQYLYGVLLSSKDRARIDLNKQVTIRNGAPGDGKSRLTVFEAYFMSVKMWFMVRYRYYRDRGRVKRWERDGNTAALADFREIEETYNYCRTPQTVTVNGKEKQVYPLPCLLSNIGIEAYGKMSSRFTYAHAMAAERAPSYSILVVDEWGTVYDVAFSRPDKKPLEVSDAMRFIRQFGEQIEMGTEQDTKNAYIDVRRVVSRNDYMQGCRLVCKPWLLLLPFRLLQMLFVRLGRGGRVLAPLCRLLEMLIAGVGFVKFRYRPEGSPEHAATSRGHRNVSFRFPAYYSKEINYDTRAFKDLNPLKDQPIKAEVHTALRIADSPENRAGFLRAKPTDDVLEERVAQFEEEQFYKDRERADKLIKVRKDYPQDFQAYKVFADRQGKRIATPVKRVKAEPVLPKKKSDALLAAADDK